MWCQTIVINQSSKVLHLSLKEMLKTCHLVWKNLVSQISQIRVGKMKLHALTQSKVIFKVNSPANPSQKPNHCLQLRNRLPQVSSRLSKRTPLATKSLTRLDVVRENKSQTIMWATSSRTKSWSQRIKTTTFQWALTTKKIPTGL